MDAYLIEVGERAMIHTRDLDPQEEEQAIALLFPRFESQFCSICGGRNH